MSNNTYQYYNQNALKLSKRYDSISFEKVHKNLLEYFPVKGKILDIGCGTGRDLVALCDFGKYDYLCGIDFSPEMINIANKKLQNIDNSKIEFIIDSLPNLKKINDKFDFIMLSAVFMFLTPQERKESFERMSEILNENGKIYISIKDQISDVSFIPVSNNEINDLSQNSDFKYKQIPSSDDCFGRNDVVWKYFIFERNEK